MEAEIPVIEAQLYKNKVIVLDEAQANQLYQRGSFGKPLSGGRLQLSPVEALYLLESDKIQVVDVRGKKLTFEALVKKFTRSDPDFMLKYIVYADLRSRA